MLGIRLQTLRDRVADDDQLRALYGRRNLPGVSGGAVAPVEVEPPGASDVVNRSPRDLPEGTVPENFDAAEIVSRADRLALERGLKKMGIEEAMLAKIKSFGNIALSGGRFLAATFQLSHQLYFRQLLGLDGQLDYITQILNEDRLQRDPTKKMTHTERVFYMRTYGNLIAESARGFKQTREGTEALVKMMHSGTKLPSQSNRKKPGWGAPAPAEPDGP